MFGGVLVAGISNWRRFRQYKRTSFQLIPTFQTLLSRQLVWILFSLSLFLFRGNCYATLCRVAFSCWEEYYQGALSELQATGKRGSCKLILARRPTLYFFLSWTFTTLHSVHCSRNANQFLLFLDKIITVKIVTWYQYNPSSHRIHSSDHQS